MEFKTNDNYCMSLTKGITCVENGNQRKRH